MHALLLLKSLPCTLASSTFHTIPTDFHPQHKPIQQSLAAEEAVNGRQNTINNVLVSEMFKHTKNRVPELPGRLTMHDEGIGRRHLQFQDLDDLLQEVTLTLPDFERTVGTFDFFDLQIVGKDIVCENFSVDNVQISHERMSDTEIAIDLTVDGLAFDCGLVWEYVSFKRPPPVFSTHSFLTLYDVLPLECSNMPSCSPWVLGLDVRWDWYRFYECCG